MKAFKRICLHDQTIVGKEGTSFTLKRGQEYTTSRIREDGTVMLFSTYWVVVPAEWLGGEQPL